MAAKPLTSEAIAITEKKMDMTLDEIIKMSKKPTTRVNNRRAPNKSQKSFNAAANQGKSSMMRQFMDSRSSLRQGALAQRRTNFQENQFRVTTATAWKAASAPIRNRPFNRLGQANFNKPRVGFRPVQRRVDAAVTGKVKKQNQNQSQLGKTLPKKKPQTLDSLFANMKEQRMRVQQNPTRNVVQPRQQGRRGRYGNFAN